MLRHLRYLAAVVDQGSFTRAAQTLHVSQPALSQQIRQLEARLGVQLLDRTGRRIRATDAGAAFLVHGKQALSAADAAEKAARDVQNLSTGQLRLGLTPSCSAYLTLELVRRFHDAYPGIHLTVTDISQDEMESALLNDRLDCGIAFSDLLSDGIELRPLHQERLSLVASPKHPIMQTPLIDALSLEQHEMALLDRAFVTRSSIDAHFRQHQMHPRIAVEASSIATLIDLVRLGRLVTVLPDVLTYGRLDLTARSLSPPFALRRVALLQRFGSYRSAASDAFVSLLDAFAGELEIERRRATPV